MKTFVDVTELVESLFDNSMVETYEVQNLYIDPTTLSDRELTVLLSDAYYLPSEVFRQLGLTYDPLFENIDEDEAAESVADWSYEDFVIKCKETIVDGLVNAIEYNDIDEIYISKNVDAWYLVDDATYKACIDLKYIIFEYCGLYFFGANNYLQQYNEILKAVGS